MERKFTDKRGNVDVQAVDDQVHKKTKHSTVCDLLEDRKHAMQTHENDVATLCIVCEPEKSSMMMGGLHPRGALYEGPINIDTARAQHAEFRTQLRELGVTVLTVREILAYNVEDNISARVDLEDLAIATGHKIEELPKEDHRWLSDVYKREVIEMMSVSQLVDTIMINPTVKLTPSGRDTGFTAYYTFEPLSNLVYTRDQSIVTSKGIVMGQMNSKKRQFEVKVMKFCFEKLGLPVIGEVSGGDAVLEGDDFYPCGEHLCILGIGMRSNLEAAQQLMDNDWIGTRRFALVKDEELNHDNLHLDSVFNILSDTCCIMNETIIGKDNPRKRIMDEYTKDPSSGKYKLTKSGTELSEFMQAEGYTVIPIKAGEHSAYACNILNVGDARIISVDSHSSRQIVKSPHFKGDIHVVDFNAITSMTGASRCACQVLHRGREVPADSHVRFCTGARTYDKQLGHVIHVPTGATPMRICQVSTGARSAKPMRMSGFCTGGEKYDKKLGTSITSNDRCQPMRMSRFLHRGREVPADAHVRFCTGGEKYDKKLGTSITSMTGASRCACQVLHRGEKYDKKLGTSITSMTGASRCACQVLHRGEKYDKKLGTSITSMTGASRCACQVCTGGEKYDKKLGTSITSMTVPADAHVRFCTGGEKYDKKLGTSITSMTGASDAHVRFCTGGEKYDKKLGTSITSMTGASRCACQVLHRGREV
eukprot:gene2145-18194_t